MKSILYIVLLFVLACTTRKISNANKNNVDIKDLQAFSFGKYQVLKIDSLNNLYIIYAQMHDSVYKIVSLKAITDACDSIQINKAYAFRLHSLFLRQISGIDVVPNDFVAGIEYYGTTIYKEKGCVNDIFFADNIRGRCYVR